MEEYLYHTRYQAAQLQEIRQRLAPLWDDEAAKEINLRYLNPHADENETMLVASAKQEVALQAVHIELRVAQESALDVEAFALEVTEQIERSEQELALCFQYFEHYGHASSTGEAIFLRIREFIGKAFAICEGVPKS